MSMISSKVAWRVGASLTTASGAYKSYKKHQETVPKSNAEKINYSKDLFCSGATNIVIAGISAPVFGVSVGGATLAVINAGKDILQMSHLRKGLHGASFIPSGLLLVYGMHKAGEGAMDLLLAATTVGKVVLGGGVKLNVSLSIND